MSSNQNQQTQPTRDQIQSLSGLGVDPYSSNADAANYSIQDIIPGQPREKKKSGGADARGTLRQGMQGDTAVDPFDVGDVGDNRGSRTQEEVDEEEEMWKATKTIYLALSNSTTLFLSQTIKTPIIMSNLPSKPSNPQRHVYQYPSGDTTAETQDDAPFLNMTEPQVGQKDEFEHGGQGQAKETNMGTAQDYASGFRDGWFYNKDQDQGRIRRKLEQGWFGGSD
ncbi:hypothetical protein BJX64DRAFT_291071 [Aspergillus heterothallicus]